MEEERKRREEAERKVVDAEEKLRKAESKAKAAEKKFRSTKEKPSTGGSADKDTAKLPPARKVFNLLFFFITLGLELGETNVYAP